MAAPCPWNSLPEEGGGLLPSDFPVTRALPESIWKHPKVASSAFEIPGDLVAKPGENRVWGGKELSEV